MRKGPRKKSTGCDLEITASAFMAADDYRNKPSGMSQFLALFTVLRPLQNWGTAASLSLVRQDT